MALLRRITNLFRRDTVDSEIAAELRAHIDLATEANMQKGLPHAEARRNALLLLGMGLLAAMLASRLLANLVYFATPRTPPGDCRNFRRHGVVLVGIVATWVPARRASPTIRPRCSARIRHGQGLATSQSRSGASNPLPELQVQVSAFEASSAAGWPPYAPARYNGFTLPSGCESQFFFSVGAGAREMSLGPQSAV